MTENTKTQKRDPNLDRFLLDPDSIVILKKGTGKKPEKCTGNSCKV